MSQWFRFYADALDNPKVQRLPPDLFKHWVNILCLAAKNDVTLHETLPCNDDMAFALRISPQDAEKVVRELVRRGLIDETQDGLVPHNWVEKQYKSDTSAERVKRHRERKRNASNVTGNVTVTPPDTESDTDTEVEERANALLSPDKPPTLDLGPTEPTAEQAAFDAYNAVAARVGIPLAQKFDQTRRSKIRQRLKDCGGLSGWVAALEKLEASSHCTGSNDRGWRADLDFLLQSQSFTRLMEGRYDDRKPQQPRRQPKSRVASDDEVRRRLFAAAGGCMEHGASGPG